MLENVGVGEVDGVWLVGILGHVGQMETQGFTKTTEFDFTDMLQAELESLLGYLLQRG